MDSKTTIQHNKLMHLEDSMVIYSIYNAVTLDQLINTVHHIHNTMLSNENTSILIHKCTRYTTLLHKLIVVSENCERYKYILSYKELIMQLLLGFWQRASTHHTHYPNKIERNSE